MRLVSCFSYADSKEDLVNIAEEMLHYKKNQIIPAVNSNR